ncbi:MAG TPA: DNA topoisomerase III [Fibrobacteraceae bacterium]|nr:DNA topoisomerase III [Fibrobacteraceae bacterium]
MSPWHSNILSVENSLDPNLAEIFRSFLLYLAAMASTKTLKAKGKTGDSGLTLIIAEKPSVAGDLVKALGGKFTKEKTHYEGGEYLVSWALGHLVTIADPGEMDERNKAWSLTTLPILPQKFELKPIADSKAQLSALGRLIRRKDVTRIINACDAGREGELIFHYILEHEQGKSGLQGKVIQRLWMQSMTRSAILDALSKLRNHAEMDNLRAAALSRSEADWLVGINSSRGLTAYNSGLGTGGQRRGFRLTPCGRVQTPTLTLIVKREQDRLSFVPRDFWTLQALFQAGNSSWEGRWFDPQFKKEDSQDAKDNASRIWDKAQAETIVTKCQGKDASVEETSKPVFNKCPPLYDLTSLQREANGRFGFSAKTTLQIAQALYERHKLTTYPRTDSKFLPEDYVDQVKTVLGTLEGSVGQHAQTALRKGWVKQDKRVFDNAKISDHHAIIPTGNDARTELSEAESKVYQLICQRFVAIFFPAAQFQQTVRIATVEDETFRTEGKVLVEPGWRAVYGKEADEELVLAPLPPNTPARNQAIEILGDQTRPPARYTESSLLSIMESAGKLIEDDELRDAMKDRGLGTPATRAAVIEGLISDKYLIREGKELVPTAKAFDLIRLTGAMQIEDLTSPELTGEWEHKLGLMERGQYTRDKFMHEIVDLTRRVVDRIKNFKEDDTRQEASFSLADGRKVTETVTAYETEDGILVRKLLGGRLMDPTEVKDLLDKGRIGPLTGFRSKRGKEFVASLVINSKGAVEFEFASDAGMGENGQAFDVNSATPLGNSPIDQSPVFDVGSAYASASALSGEKTGLRISKVILGRTLSPNDITRMLHGESTELLKDFVSSRTRKKFDAKLKLSKVGKIEFEFPPREPKAGGRRWGKPKVPKKDDNG